MAVKFGTSGYDFLYGGNDNDFLYGFEGIDLLYGYAGNDELDGGSGADVMYGGVGDDTYYFENYGDVAVENAGEGIDTVYSSVTTTLGAYVENLILQAGAGAINGTGNELANKLTGNSSANMLFGGTGDDELSGGAGNDDLRGGDGFDRLDGGTGADIMIGGLNGDTYVVDDAGDLVIEENVSGIDTVESSITYVLGNYVENLRLTGSANIYGTGNALHNDLFGNSGANVLRGEGGNDELDGGAGADIMFGGTGDDFYTVDNAGDAVIEYAGEGYDVVQSSVSYTLGADLEELALMDAGGAINGTGNALNNALWGNDFANTLTGGAGDDDLWGGLGNDTMLGGTGNDEYWVRDAGDVVTENANEGTDTVYSRINHTLGANFENLTIYGSANQGTGNNLANVITSWNSGSDTLYGLGGDDTLDGDAGADVMYGGTGWDTYIVDNAGDLVIENLNEGIDTVKSSVSYTLGANVDSLTLTGTEAINGTGNELRNTMHGNSASNVLNGGAGSDTLDGRGGADTMIGGSGDEWYFVDDAGDQVIEYANEGMDVTWASISYTLTANVEVLCLDGNGAISGYGNALDNELVGNNAANTLSGLDGADTLRGYGGDDFLWGGNSKDKLFGGDGDDVLIGGADADQLTGGKGADTFMFRTLNDSSTSAADQIMDFAQGLDLIDISQIDSRPTVSGDQPFSFIGANNFSGVAGQLHFQNGYVEGDINGDAVADFAIQVLNVSSLSASDFIL